MRIEISDPELPRCPARAAATAATSTLGSSRQVGSLLPPLSWLQGAPCRGAEPVPHRSSQHRLPIHFQTKSMVYKGERGHYPSVSSSVPMAPGSPCR